MTHKPTPHPHSAFIAEALQDMSREIEGQHRTDGWDKSNLSHVIECSTSWEFRFADTVKPVTPSSMTDNELIEASLGTLSGHERRRKIADAAATRAVEEERARIMAMPDETSLEDIKRCSEGLTWPSVAVAVIQQFKHDIGGVK